MFEKEAEAFVSEKADKGNFDLEQFGKAYFSESSMKQTLVKFTEQQMDKQRDQLAKAKELILKLSTCLEGHSNNRFEYELLQEAEQFLKEE